MPKKLKLDVSRLEVETFEPLRLGDGRGTVRGLDSWWTEGFTCPQGCDDGSRAPGCEPGSDWISCPQTCDYTCDDPSCGETVCQNTCLLLPETNCGCQ